MKNKLLNLSAKELSGRCGVYLISCKNHCYIGSSKSLYQRLREHRYRLINDTHSNDFMQNVFNKHGIESFEFEILEECTLLARVLLETKYIKDLRPDLNIQQDPELKTVSNYTRQKLSKSVKKGRAEGKYKTKYDYVPVEQYDYFGNHVHTHHDKATAAEFLGVTKKKVQALASGYRKGLCWKGVRLRYANSKVPVQSFEVDPKYLGKHFDFYCDDEFAFSSIKNVWAFLAQKIKSGDLDFNIQVRLKDPTRSP